MLRKHDHDDRTHHGHSVLRKHDRTHPLKYYATFEAIVLSVLGPPGYEECNVLIRDG